MYIHVVKNTFQAQIPAAEFNWTDGIVVVYVFIVASHIRNQIRSQTVFRLKPLSCS